MTRKASRTKQTEPERSYTVPQVAKAMGVTQAVVRRWIKTGQLAGWQLDNEAYRIDESALQAFKDARRVLTGADTRLREATPGQAKPARTKGEQ